METKKLIIIGALVIIICVLLGALFGILSQNTQYERIEITPNGTSMEIPTDNATYAGEINNTGAKLWTFKQGTLTTYNSEEAANARGLYSLGGALGIKEIKDMVLNHFEKKETIEGYTVYTLDGDTMDIPGRDKVYVIETGNDTTHDNIIIATDNKDITLHIAKSIQYKTSNSTNTTNLNVTNNEPTATNNPSTNNVTSSNEKSNEELPVSYYSQHPEDEGYYDYDDSYYEDEYEDIESESSSSYDSSSSASVDSSSSSASSG